MAAALEELALDPIEAARSAGLRYGTEATHIS
jgi:hypothetical protein